FTRHLLEGLRMQGVSLDDAMKRVSRDVARATNDQQVPAIYGLLLEDVILLPGRAAPVIEVVPIAAPPPPPPPRPADGSPYVPTRIRVGGNVQQSMLIEQQRPIYPPDAKKSRIQGTVRLSIIIGKDGTVIHLTVESGHSLLVPAALEAVKKWI